MLEIIEKNKQISLFQCVDKLIRLKRNERDKARKML